MSPSLRYFDTAVAMVQIDELHGLLPQLSAAVASIEAVKEKIMIGRSAIVTASDRAPGPEGYQIRVELERFTAALPAAAQALPTSTAAIAAAWSSFATRLTADATSKLEANS